MRPFFDLRPRRAALTALAAVGLLAAALPAALALEAWRATHRHRAAAERALRDHATFAALSFRQRLIGRVYGAVGAVLQPVGNARAAYPAGPLPPLAPLRRASEAARACDCGPAVVPSYYFRLTLADSSLEVDGPPLPAGRRAWLVREFTDLGELREARDWELTSSVDTLAPDGGEVVYAAPRRGPDGLPLALYGLAVTLASLRETMLRPTLAGPPLLPIAPRGAPPNDSLLSVDLLAPVAHDGVIRGVISAAARPALALSPRRLPADYSATIPGGIYLGGQLIRVSLDPRTAPPVLIGGLPPSRTPLLAALVLLTAALIAATLVAAWREHALARLRADFVAGVSHELRTPLAQILLFGETLAAGRMDSRRDVRDAGKVIVGEARRLMQLVENVLLFGRAGRAAGAAPLPPEPLAPLVREVVAAFAPIAAAADARVRTARLDDVLAPADRAAVRQILLNLLDNAVKYGPPGQTVSVGLALAGERARLWVEDEGPGVPAADRERVWQPFVRLSRDVEAQVGGSGIGLAVVRDLVARHGGSARIDAAPAGGACVIVELPDARGGGGPRLAAEEATCAS
ncbi:MAG TPA: HAMP domain-containing sensor histidine kinase [Gemmatimonadaceae bacterium]|nr:HAMP domain-containing sensor histidine kinase [Gemmatimonadaceae bacterium]